MLRLIVYHFFVVNIVRVDIVHINDRIFIFVCHSFRITVLLEKLQELLRKTVGQHETVVAVRSYIEHSASLRI